MPNPAAWSRAARGWVSKPIQQIVKFVQQIKITQKVVKCDQVVEKPNDVEV